MSQLRPQDGLTGKALYTGIRCDLKTTFALEKKEWARLPSVRSIGKLCVSAWTTFIKWDSSGYEPIY